MEGEIANSTRHGERGRFRPRCSVGRPFPCLHLCPSIFPSCCPLSSACPSISLHLSVQDCPYQAASPAAAVLLEPGKKLKDAHISTVERILSARESGGSAQTNSHLSVCPAREPRRLEGGWRAAAPGGDVGAVGRESGSAHQPLRPGTASMSKPAGSTSGYLSGSRGVPGAWP